MKARHIFMTADCVGGVWTYALDLVRSLPPDRFRFTLAVMGSAPSPAQMQEVARSPNVELHFRPYKVEWMEEPWEEVEAASRWLLDLARERKPDLVHLNGYVHADLSWPCPVIIVAHSCLCSWWWAVLQKELPPRLSVYRQRVESGLNAADLIVAPSASMLDSLNRFYRWSTPDLVVANGRDPTLFRAGDKVEEIVTVGRLWDEAKGIEFLDQIAPDLRWPVTVVGKQRSPAGKAILLRHVAASGTLLPVQVSERLARAAIFVAPARYEPFGLAVLEAALSGCVLVISDIPSFRENWEGAAVFLNPYDRFSWVEALNELANDPLRRAELGTLAKARALALEPGRMGQRYQRVYESLLEDRVVSAGLLR